MLQALTSFDVDVAIQAPTMNPCPMLWFRHQAGEAADALRLQSSRTRGSTGWRGSTACRARCRGCVVAVDLELNGMGLVLLENSGAELQVGR